MDLTLCLLVFLLVAFQLQALAAMTQSLVRDVGDVDHAEIDEFVSTGVSLLVAAATLPPLCSADVFTITAVTVVGRRTLCL